MAHFAALETLGTELTARISGKTVNDAAFPRLRNDTVRGLKNQHYARTNQFEVRDRYNGLVEKFAVRDREDLSEALKQRLDELPTSSKWLPEVLSLLLELSDRPLEKPSLESLKATAQPTVVEPELSWDEIIADDPFDEPDIWDNIERGYHSSGDDEISDEINSQRTAATSRTSVDEQDAVTFAKLQLKQPSISVLENVRTFQDFQGSEDQAAQLSELTLARQMLTLLHGLPMEVSGLNSAVKLSTASSSTVRTLLGDVLDTASALKTVRQWTSSRQTLAYLQSMQEAVSALLVSFSNSISEIDRRFVGIAQNTVVSAIEISAEARSLARPLIAAASILERLPESALQGTDYALLDCLFDQVCIAQLVGDRSVFQPLAQVVASGLQTYLVSAANWMQNGVVVRSDKDNFFVKDLDETCDKANVWQNRFTLQCQKDGRVLAPKCLANLIAKIFALGKSRMFLGLLSQNMEVVPAWIDLKRTLPLLKDLQYFRECDDVLPFADQLAQTLEKWISEVAFDYIKPIRQILLHDHGLQKTLGGLPSIYFSQDGASFQLFADALADRLSSKTSTNSSVNNFLMTELAGETFGGLESIDANGLFVTNFDQDDGSIASSKIRKLSKVKMGYAFNWAIQNITRCRSSEVHAKIAALLLQLNHAKRQLQPQTLAFKQPTKLSGVSLTLRSSLLCFIDTLWYHTVTAASTLHRSLQEKMATAEDVDTMISLWAQYVKRLDTHCLSSMQLAPLRAVVTEILEICEIMEDDMEPAPARALQARFREMLAFFTNGTHSIGRTANELALSGLAERLKWIKPPDQ